MCDTKKNKKKLLNSRAKTLPDLSERREKGP